MVIVLVSTTFLVQNQYYASQIQRSAAFDNARSATEMMATELRGLMREGVVVAGARTLTIRTPMIVGVVCNRLAGFADIHSTGGVASLDTLEIAGVGRRSWTTGDWSYGNATWSSLKGYSGAEALDCRVNGADTVGAKDDFYRLKGLTPLVGPPDEGDLLMLFRQTTFTIKRSVMDTTSLGLFRTAYGGSAVEYATGMDTSASFRYRRGGSTYYDTVNSVFLDQIDVIRIVADARRKAVTGGVQDVTFGWTTDLWLRNVR